jgi:hypothetical protein
MSGQAFDIHRYSIRGDIDWQPAENRLERLSLLVLVGPRSESDEEGILPKCNDFELGPHSHLFITNKWN